MRHKLKLIHSRPAAFLLTLVTLLSIDTVQAQCPEDPWGPAPSAALYPWTSGYSYTMVIPGTSCEIEIHYCKRYTPMGTQAWIYEILPLDDGGCDGITNDAIIHAARDGLFNDADLNGSVPCFKGSTQTTEVYLAQCWSMQPVQVQPPGSNNPWGLYPCTGEAWCSKICYVCYDESGIHISDCQITTNNVSISCQISPPQWLQ